MFTFEIDSEIDSDCKYYGVLRLSDLLSVVVVLVLVHWNADSEVLAL